MSKHLKQLKKLNKRVLGLNSESLKKEIDVLIKRSAELPELKFTASENVKAAEVLANMVDKYHLKETLLIKDEKTGDLGLPTNSSQLTNIKESVFVELSAKCSTVSVIDSAKKRVDSFFNLDFLSKNELDSETSSSVINYVRFIQNASNYSYDSMYYYFLELLEKGEIKINLPKEEKIPSEETFTQVEKMILSYRDTFIKNYVSYLPTFMEYKTSLQTELDYGYGKYVARLKEGEQLTREDAIRVKFTQFTNDIIDELISFEYSFSEIEKINSIEGYKKSITSSVLNLKLQNDNSKNIITLYGETYLGNQKEIFSSLDTENSSIESKISTLQNEQINITNVNNEKKEQLEDLESLLGSVDTDFINNNSLSSIISASSAHTETLKIYSGARIDKLIRDAIAKGEFEVEVFELTDIEAKILLDNGYFIKETTEVNVIDPNNTSEGRREEILTTWTINWESANSVVK